MWGPHRRITILVSPIYYPKDPRTRIIGFLGPKYCNIIGIGALKPYYLGPWTLRVIVAGSVAQIFGKTSNVTYLDPQSSRSSPSQV